jgi:transposase-like protein
MANIEIRNQMLLNRIPQWKLAEKIGISENTVYRWLRTDMDNKHKTIVMNAINDLIQVKSA